MVKWNHSFYKKSRKKSIKELLNKLELIERNPFYTSLFDKRFGKWIENFKEVLDIFDIRIVSGVEYHFNRNGESLCGFKERKTISKSSIVVRNSLLNGFCVDCLLELALLLKNRIEKGEIK